MRISLLRSVADCLNDLAGTAWLQFDSAEQFVRVGDEKLHICHFVLHLLVFAVC